MKTKYKYLLSIIVILVMTIIVLLPIYSNNKFYQNTYETNNVSRKMVEKSSYNLVFWKKGCPYCEAGLKAVKDKDKDTKIETMYIDTQSKLGKELTAIYGIKRASTIVKVRNDRSTLLEYATKINNKIVSDDSNIEKAFNY